jgi:DNA primase
LAEKGIECYRVLFPSGKDANGYAQSIKGGPDAVAQALGDVLRKALWLGKGEMLGLAGVDVAAPEAGAAPAPAALAPAPASAPAPTPVYVSAPAPVPASPAPTLVAQVAPEIKGDDVHFSFGTGANARRYRVRGMGKNLAVAVLKINLMASCGEAFYVDTLDLYSAKQRGAFVLQAGNELGVDTGLLKADLGKLLLALEQMQDEAIAKALNPAQVVPEMGEEARAAALAMLQAPDLVARIRSDMEAIGITGEATNKLVGYLAATSRMLNNPLAIVIRSSSAAGKTSLMDAVLAMMPEEERIKYSAMTGQSLFYMGQANLKHKILALAEEEGASRASYALKLLQSEGELTMASTGKDPVSGNLITQEYRVEGPVMLFTTTTALDIDPELLNRCLVLTVDESREQTQAIHKLQRNKRTLQGLVLAQEKAAILALHQNAQRLLRPLAIMNPFADRLTFPDSATRMRRDHEKYLTLIDAIALLHQHQRPVKSVRCAAGEVDYIEVTAADIERANALAHDVLGRSLDDLPPQTRALLNALCDLVASRAIAQGILRSEVRFTRREAREELAMGGTQLRLHMERLIEYEYLIPRRDGAGGKFHYELVYDASAAEKPAYMPGLIDVAAFNIPTSDKLRGQTSEVAGRLRGDFGPIAGRLRGGEIGANAATARVSGDVAEEIAKTHVPKKNKKDVTHPQKDTYMQFGPENGPAINGAPVKA